MDFGSHISGELNLRIVPGIEGGELTCLRNIADYRESGHRLANDLKQTL
jgi:hypothetical protein